MDPVTHTLTGAALARAGLDRTTPLATATLIIAANVPDIDVLAYAQGEYAALAFRRGLTHGPIGLLVLPVLTAFAVAAFDTLWRRRRRPSATPVRLRALLVLAWLGALTHPALDWMNTYGIRLLAPFDGRWFYGDALFIIDPWLWLIALGAAAAGAVFTRRRAVRVGLALAVLYVGGMIASDRAARAVVERSARAEGHAFAPRDIMVAPAPLNPLRAEVLIATADAYHLGRFDWLRDPRVTWSDTIPFGPRGAFVDAALREPQVRDFLTWSRFPFVEVQQDGDGAIVRFGDARYDDMPAAGGLSGVSVRVR